MREGSGEVAMTTNEERYAWLGDEWRPPPIPTRPCFMCGIETSESQSVFGVGHRACYMQAGRWCLIRAHWRDTLPRDKAWLYRAPCICEPGTCTGKVPVALRDFEHPRRVAYEQAVRRRSG